MRYWAHRRGGIPAGGFPPHRRGGHLRRDSGCTRLMGGDVDALLRAQGVALSLCSGSMAFLDDGSWTKRFTRAGQPLRHFRLQLWACQDSRPGKLMAVASGSTPLRSRHVGGDRSRVLAVVSRVGCARLPSSPIPFVTSIMRRSMRRWHCVAHGLTPDAIESATILLDQRQFGVVVDPIEAKRVPQKEYDAKYRAPYAVATALCKGRFSLA